MRSFLKDNKKFIWLFFIIGICLIISGFLLAYLYFNHEVLDDKFIVKDATSYEAEDISLESGQILVLRDIKYISNGEYKITYKSKIKKDSFPLFEEKTSFVITDIFNEDYKLKQNKLTINGKKLKLEDGRAYTDDYVVRYSKNKLEVTCIKPNSLKKLIVTVYAKLESREVGKKYTVSNDAYYGFTPSNSNSFYTKKTPQSYIIEGNAYIVLKDK